MSEKVHILRETLIPLPTDPGGGRQMLRVMYQAAGMLPRTVYIDPDHDSPEERARVISNDLKAAREHKPPALEVP